MAINHPNFGRLDNDRVIIFDTTLRDGEQAPGFSMNRNEKLKMAEALEALGVDVLEAGFPIASPDDFEGVRAIAERADSMVVCGLARAQEADIRACAEALRGARRKRIHTFISTSPLHMERKLRMAPEAVIDAIAGSVSLARALVDDVEWSAEDATRSDPDFLVRAVETAIAAGATTINVPDTVGYALPEDLARLFAQLRERTSGADRVIFSTHNHNDLGLAVANALAAVSAGARQIECAVNGIGERAGNTALEEVVMALKTRADRLAFGTGIDSTRILRTSRLLSAITGFDAPPNKAIVGRNAFAHESGIHQDGMLKDSRTYEIMTPESVGWTQSSLVLGKHSGRAAFRAKLRAMGYDGLSEEAVEAAFSRFKAVADKKKTVFEEDLLELIDEAAVRGHERIGFESLDLVSGSKKPPFARVGLRVDGAVVEAGAGGQGPVDAAFNAVRELVPHQASLMMFAVHAVTEGTDAQARTTVRLGEEGVVVDGQGSDPDTVIAAVRAYVHALNKLLIRREREATRAA